VTPAQTEGPYYKENPPEEGSLLQPGMPGTRLTVTGYVLDEQCRPVPGARVDFWQADSAGQYDNQGYTLRGYQLTDAEGRYTLETVLPGLYTGRTRHIHVKVSPPSGPTLTSQLYFPDEAANASDRIFSPELVVNLEKTADGETGTFNFVVKTQ
jgi:protocatechuate 3,4-dioxygenase beta subunit